MFVTHLVDMYNHFLLLPRKNGCFCLGQDGWFNSASTLDVRVAELPLHDVLLDIIGHKHEFPLHTLRPVVKVCRAVIAISISISEALCPVQTEWIFRVQLPKPSLKSCVNSLSSLHLVQLVDDLPGLLLPRWIAMYLDKHRIKMRKQLRRGMMASDDQRDGESSR